MEHPMMKTFVTLSCGLVLLGSQIAGADDAPKTVMPTGDKDYSHLTTLPPQQTGEAKDRCAELLQQMEALKGKPQRRYAVSQQYEAECQRY